MVDPNPARGMPLALQRYWLAGKGGLKIRWGMPHDFNRCVRNLRKYFPKNPEGLCNILHQKALGAPPGKGHAERAITASASLLWADELEAMTAAAQALMDRQPKLGEHLWAGPIAPIGRPTGEPRRTRVFEPGALRHRTLPLPLAWRERTSQGHEGAVTVGRILGITYGPDHMGLENAYAWGDMLDEEIIPDAKKARYLMQQGVVGGSVDPGGAVRGTVNPANGFEYTTEYTIGGVTTVSIPAFDAMQLFCFKDGEEPFDDDDPDMSLDMEGDCGCGPTHPMGAGRENVKEMAALKSGVHYAVNPAGWHGLALAPRETVFDNDDAVKRIAAWAGVTAGGADVEKLRKAFMWSDPNLPPTATQSYRMPLGDVVNNELVLIYHAIYAAAALISGAHGGLPGIPDEDKNELRNMITDIYKVMASEFNDPSIRAPWDRPENEGQQFAMAMGSDLLLAPPAAWFENPRLESKTPLTVTEDGYVYGHLAAWNECHRDVTNRECVLPPHSMKEYAPFHLGSVLTADGDTIRVGKIVQDTRHASIRLGYAAAAVHYDNTGDEIAVIRCGEDDFGIWFAGALVPEATPQRVAKLRRSPISGDWRGVDGNLELTAALAVNVPAFPVYAMEHDERTALVAAGVVYPEQFEEPLGYRLPVANHYVPEPPTGITNVEAFSAGNLRRLEEEQVATEDRLARLQDLLEDEEIYTQRERAERLSSFSMDES